MRAAIRFVCLTILLAQAAVADHPNADTAKADTSKADVEAQQGPVQVGDFLRVTHTSDAFKGTGRAGERALVWRTELYMPEASYVAPHFSHFALPEGTELVVRAPDGSRSWSYRGFGKAERLLEEGFWGIHIQGELAIVELWSQAPLAEGAVVIDGFAHGFPDAFSDPSIEAICGSDDSEWAKCYQTSEAAIYDESRAVARLLINGTGACTGWLVGDEGHLMTNEHCIGNSSSALNTNYEFLAEGATCGTNCASWGACSGTVVATSATLVQLDSTLDYTLVKLPTNPTSTYGFMQLRSSGAVVNERIYVPQHPAHWGKRIGVFSSASSDGSGFCEVYSLNQAPCSGGGGSDVGYFCDTQGGSSGSPVLGYSDHLVVALHHCANCPNRGVPIQAIISDLGSNLPNNALGGGGGPGGPCSGCIDWSTTATTSYSNQDVSSNVSSQDGGATLFLQNNTWRRTTQTFNVTPDTVVEFEFRSTQEGEIHGIGFDENDTLSDAVRIFQLFGTQNWGTANHDFDNYTSGDLGSYKSYRIPVGQYYTGSSMYLVLVNDNDSGSGNTSYFRDVKVFEDGSTGGGCTVDEDFSGGVSGWINSAASTCSTGDFVVAVPTQVTNGGVVTQVGGDHTTGGGNALFTATNSSAGVNDVDGGVCILESPTWSVSEASDLSVWYFHGQRDAGDDPSGDFFRLELSTNGGSSYSTLVSFGDVQQNAAWSEATASIAAGASVKLRVQVSDGSGPGDLVEGGIDDVSICASN